MNSSMPNAMTFFGFAKPLRFEFGMQRATTALFKRVGDGIRRAALNRDVHGPGASGRLGSSRLSRAVLARSCG
ncbi:MAG: hypothetical protein ACK4FW_03155 [Stenotrophomonas sp.]